MAVSMLLIKELFKFVATLSAGLFGGGALYVTVVEIPSRRHLPTAPRRLQWKNSFNLASKYMPMMGFLNCGSSIAMYFLDESKTDCNWCWLISPVIFLITGIYSFTVIVPEVMTMLDDTIIHKKGEKWVDDAIDRWDRRNNMRTFLDILLFVFTVIAVVHQ